MTSEPSFQLPQRATDPHEFPATRDDWHNYRRWLAQYGGKLGEQLRSAPTLPEREAARREWEAVADLTGRAEEAYERFQIAQEDAEYADFARTLANRIHADWVSPNSLRPARDASREALTSIAYNEGEEGLTAGHPVGLDQKGRELSALMEKLDTPEGSPVMRLPRANVLALTLVLEEFAARLMLARQTGELTEGDAYIQAVVELQADLESRRYGE